MVQRLMLLMLLIGIEAWPISSSAQRSPRQYDMPKGTVDCPDSPPWLEERDELGGVYLAFPPSGDVLIVLRLVPIGSQLSGFLTEIDVEGQGIASYVNGLVYEGGFLKGKNHGKGKMTYPDGYSYVGDWKDGSREGQGVATYADGTTYTGGFVAGQREGEGEIVMKDGFRYKGGWKAGEIDGKGVATYPNGDVYEGEFKAGKRQGQGTMRYATGETATGTWAEGALKEAAPAAAPAEAPAEGN